MFTHLSDALRSRTRAQSNNEGVSRDVFVVFIRSTYTIYCTMFAYELCLVIRQVCASSSFILRRLGAIVLTNGFCVCQVTQGVRYITGKREFGITLNIGNEIENIFYLYINIF